MWDGRRIKRLFLLMEGRNVGKVVRGGSFIWESVKFVCK